MSNTELHHLGVAELAAQLRAKQVSATEAAQHFWPAPRPTRTWAPLCPNEDATLAQAKAADALIAAGKGGKLAGVPIAHKDIFVTKDFPTTAGSRCWRATSRRSTPPWCASWRRRGHPGQAQLRRVRHGLGQRELGRGPGGL
jgi:Asp-tRNA(Asn)/Glu-tRNA(Gln) amidotransferase A subunit family amidase